MKKSGILVFVSSALVFLSLNLSTAWARWATLEDQAYVVDEVQSIYQVTKEGLVTTTNTFVIEIRRDDARAGQGLQRIHYEPNSQKVELLEALTLNGDQVIPVPPDGIEDKPLASTGSSFDAVHQITLAFPQVDVGSKIRFRYRLTKKQVPIPHFFAALWALDNEYIRKLDLQIDSELPLRWKFHDPDKFLKLSKKEKDGRTLIQIQSRKVIHREVIDEEYPAINPKDYPWVLVSSGESWGKHLGPVLDDHERVVSAELPVAYSKILEWARMKKTTLDQMNEVTSRLADTVRYLGDWRTVRGGHIPRDLEVAARTQFGDCKDYAAATVAILRKLGIQAHFVWVIRAFEPPFQIVDLPHDHFNHAIVRAEVGGQVYWLDPTNRASFAQGIFEDIIDRPALVLDPKNPRLETIPPASAEDTEIETFQEIQRDDKGKVRVVGYQTFRGREAASRAGQELESSKESIFFSFISSFTQGIPLESWSVTNEHLRSRITEDLTFQFEYRPRKFFLQTSAGLAYTLHTPEIFLSLFGNQQSRVSDLFIGQPYTYRSRVVIKNAKKVGNTDLGCEFSSPWFQGSRRIQQVEADLEIQDLMILRKPKVMRDEFQTKSFLALQQRFLKCFGSSAVIFE